MTRIEFQQLHEFIDEDMLLIEALVKCFDGKVSAIFNFTWKDFRK